MEWHGCALTIYVTIALNRPFRECGKGYATRVECTELVVALGSAAEAEDDRRDELDTDVHADREAVHLSPVDVQKRRRGRVERWWFEYVTTAQPLQAGAQSFRSFGAAARESKTCKTTCGSLDAASSFVVSWL